MAVEALKSPSITNLDASPVVANTAGEGGPAVEKVVSDFVTISASASATSTYRLVRLPSNCKVKNVWLESEAQTAGKINLSVYYSDSVVDNALAGVIVPSTGDQFFASDVDLSSAVRVDATNESGNYPISKRNLPLWSALGLASDPGGFFDVVAVVHTTDITTGIGKMGVIVSYTD